MAGVTISARGNLPQVLEGYEERIRNMRPAMEAVAEVLIELVSTSFVKEESPWGTPWKGHSVTTQILGAKGGLFGRGRGGGSEALLVDTGAHKNSFYGSATASRAEVRSGGRAAKYGHVHQFGNPQNRLPNVAPGVFAARKGRKARANFPPLAPIPPRPFMPLLPNGKTDLPAETSAEIRATLIDWISGRAG